MTRIVLPAATPTMAGVRLGVGRAVTGVVSAVALVQVVDRRLTSRVPEGRSA